MTDLYLLRLTTTHPIRETVQLSDNLSAAIDEAKLFVGEHNPVDGCSSPRSEWVGQTGFYRTSRSTSFGTRSASVQPIGFEPTNLR